MSAGCAVFFFEDGQHQGRQEREASARRCRRGARRRAATEAGGRDEGAGGCSGARAGPGRRHVTVSSRSRPPRRRLRVLALSLTPCVLLFPSQAGAPWPEAWRSYREASCGAVNLGASCFLNAALQALVPVWYSTYGVCATPAAPLAKLAVAQMDPAGSGCRAPPHRHRRRRPRAVGTCPAARACERMTHSGPMTGNE